MDDGVDPVPVLGTRRPSATTSPSRDFTAADASTRRHFVDKCASATSVNAPLSTLAMLVAGALHVLYGQRCTLSCDRLSHKSVRPPVARPHTSRWHRNCTGFDWGPVCMIK